MSSSEMEHRGLPGVASALPGEIDRLTTNLALLLTWRLDTNAITSSNGTNWVMVPFESASWFFQLRR